MPLNKLYSDNRSSVWRDTEQNIIIKKFSKPDTGRTENLKHYMEFQKTTDDIVKVVEIIDDKSFSMEHLNMVTMAHPLLAYYHISQIREHYSYESFLKSRGKNPQWYLQEEFADLLDKGEADLLLKEFDRNTLLDLIATVNNVWTKGLEYSKRLPDQEMWSCGDVKLGNIAVIKEDNKIAFKFIDPNSWEILPGFFSMETYFTTQMQLSFVSQALLNKVIK